MAARPSPRLAVRACNLDPVALALAGVGRRCAGRLVEAQRAQHARLVAERGLQEVAARPPAALAAPAIDDGRDLGFGRIVASAIEEPNMLANLV